MGRKGSQKNEQKVNAERAHAARRAEAIARARLQAIRSLAIGERTPEYAKLLRLQQGILKKAIDARRKSETHSRQDKGGKR